MTRAGCPRRAALGFLLLLSCAPPALPQEAAPVPRVRLIATGGTISNRSGGRLTADELARSMPGVERYARVEAEQFANTASSQLTLEQWVQLAKRIQQVLTSERDLAGVVVTSGTDTLEELAYFLHLTIKDERPVVVVGSMRNPNTLGYEGAANLLEGVRVAADPASRRKGTLVVLNDEINAAREVTKTDALRLQTFQSRPSGVLGVVDSDRVVFYREPVKRRSFDTEFDITRIETLPRVDVLLVYQGAPGDLIRAAVDAGAQGVVIATAGAGATSGTQFEGIQYAIGKGAPVVITTRAGSGRIAARRRRFAGEDAPALLIAGEDLMPVKARVLLMLALTKTKDPAEIQRMFTEY
ncbi:MAG TPA: asparaginase [Vicinamibacterales bacterium]|nr:asparaginase [Vicinamibacterales bacterium]